MASASAGAIVKAPAPLSSASGRSRFPAPAQRAEHIHLRERHRALGLREIGIASLTMTFLTIIPALMIMVVIDRVVVYQSYSTLAMLAVIAARWYFSLPVRQKA